MKGRSDTPNGVVTDDAGEGEDHELGVEAGREEEGREEEEDHQQDDRDSTSPTVGEVLLRKDGNALGHGLLVGELLWRRTNGGWRRIGDGLLVSHGHSTNDLVVEVDLELLATAHLLEQSEDVVGVHLGGNTAHAAGELLVADDGDTVVDDLLAGLGELAVTTGSGGEIDNDGAGLHDVDGLLLEKDGGSLAGNGGGGDDDVALGSLLLEELHLSGDVLVAHGLGVTAGTLAGLVLGVVEDEEGSTHGLDLLLADLTGIEAADIGTEGLGSTNGLETGDTGTDDQDLGGLVLTGGGDLGGEEALVVVAGLDDGTVAGNLTHGGEGVEFLSSGGTGDHIHGEPGHALVGEFLELIGMLGGGGVGDENLTLTKESAVLGGGLVDLDDDVGLGVDVGVGDDLDANAGVLGGKDLGSITGALLNEDLEAELAELDGDVGGDGDSGLLLSSLERDTDGLEGGELLGLELLDDGTSDGLHLVGGAGLDGLGLLTEEVDDVLDGLLGITKVHVGVLVEEERVLDIGVTGLHGTLDDDGALGLPDTNDGHAGDGGLGVGLGGGVDGIVGTDGEDDVVLGHGGVDLLHLKDDVVGDVGLGEEDVHVAGETAGDGVDTEADVLAGAAEDVGELSNGVLGVGDGHTVAGDDEDVLSVPEVVSDTSGIDGEVGALGLLGLGLLGGGALTEATGEDVHEGTVHGLAHDVGKNGTGGGDDGTGDDEDAVLHHEAGHGAGDAGEGVEHGDDDGHIGATDGDDEVDTVDKGDDDEAEHVEPVVLALGKGAGVNAHVLTAIDVVVGGETGEDHEGEDDDVDENVPEHLALDVDVADGVVELQAGDDGAREGHEADEEADEEEGHLEATLAEGEDATVLVAGELAEVEGDAFQSGSETTEGVEETDHLGHAGHGDGEGHVLGDEAGGARHTAPIIKPITIPTMGNHQVWA